MCIYIYIYIYIYIITYIVNAEMKAGSGKIALKVTS